MNVWTAKATICAAVSATVALIGCKTKSPKCLWALICVAYIWEYTP